MLVQLALGGRLRYSAYFRSSDLPSVVASFAYCLLRFFPFALFLSTLVFPPGLPCVAWFRRISCCGISTRPYGMFFTRIVLPGRVPR
jgi:hypothetical protein